jgi:hypothetical protein
LNVHSPLLAVIDDQAATTADPGIVEQQMGAIGRMLCRGAGAYIPTEATLLNRSACHEIFSSSDGSKVNVISGGWQKSSLVPM